MRVDIVKTTKIEENPTIVITKSEFRAIARHFASWKNGPPKSIGLRDEAGVFHYMPCRLVDDEPDCTHEMHK